jgi:hypothetical protein
MTAPDGVIRPDGHVGWGGGNYVPNVQALNHWWKSREGNIGNTGVAPAFSQPNPFTHPELKDFTDGTSSTVVFAERYNICPLPTTGAFGRTHWLGTQAAKYDSVFAWNNRFTPVTSSLYGRDDFAGRGEVPQIAPVEVCDEPDKANCPDNMCDPERVQTAHAVMNVVLMDGSVQTISGDIDYLAWRAYILPRDEGAPPK